MKLIKSKKGFALLAALVVVAVGAIGGYAYWTQGGSGNGSATTGTTTAITVNQTSVSAATLYPGGPAEDLSGDFDNPNPGGVVISSVTAVVSSVTPLPGNTFVGNGKPNCTAADYSIGGSAAGSTVPPGNSVGAWTGLNVSLLNTASNQDNCKGATANITYTANP
jgi:hypothetical protein